MEIDKKIAETRDLLRSLGFPNLRIHTARNHFDFTRSSRRILVIGPMGSGKTEYASRVWRDAQVALKKDPEIGPSTGYLESDRRRVFVIRSQLDMARFPDNPQDALSYRDGYERCGTSIGQAPDSFEVERLIGQHPEIGTWIIDEASFYDERLAYVVLQASHRRRLVFIFPTLMLNFRRDIFNSTAALLLEHSTDIFPLTAYCEHPRCLNDALYSYRYYLSEGVECPALYFDPLIIIGGDRQNQDWREPNYCARCERHHLLPGKEYTFLTLKPLGERAASGDPAPLIEELRRIKEEMRSSLLYDDFQRRYDGEEEEAQTCREALRISCIAERALIFLFAEQNLVTEDLVRHITRRLDLDRGFLSKRAADNRRPIRRLAA